MSTPILFNKPFGVLTQFTGDAGQKTLADYISRDAVYPAGRLDKDSEGLVVLTDDGKLQHRISDPRHKLAKVYWVQVEGEVTTSAMNKLERGVVLKDGKTKPACARKLEPPANLWPREPPIRVRKTVPDSWLELTLFEGRNRQVRRMTAAVGFPTLRLIRVSIGPWNLGELQPGEWSVAEVGLDATNS